MSTIALIVIVLIPLLLGGGVTATAPRRAALHIHTRARLKVEQSTDQ